MSEGRKKRAVKAKVLLVAAAGSAVLTFGSCGPPFTSGNLIAPPQCGTDGGPPGCIGGTGGGGHGGGGGGQGGGSGGGDAGTHDGGTDGG